MRIVVFLMVGILGQGCKQDTRAGTNRAEESPVDVVPSRASTEDVGTWAAGGLKVTSVDLNGDGKLEWVVATAQELRVVAADGTRLATTPLSGGIQVLSSATIDNQNVVLVGTGLTVARREALGRMSVFRLEDGRLEEDLIFQMEPIQQRHEIVAALQREDGSLLLAHYQSRFLVTAQTVRWTKDGWIFEPIGTFRMATSWALGDADNDGVEDIVVGRVYGEEDVNDGDAFLLRPDGSRVPIPTLRGVRGLLIHDVDGDGTNEVYLGDGWHQKYQAQAEPILSRAEFRDGAFRTTRLHTLEDDVEYTIWDIFAGPEGIFYARSNAALYKVTTTGFKPLASAVGDAAVGNVGEILVVGPVPQIISTK